MITERNIAFPGDFIICVSYLLEVRIEALFLSLPVHSVSLINSCVLSSWHSDSSGMYSQAQLQHNCKAEYETLFARSASDLYLCC